MVWELFSFTEQPPPPIYIYIYSQVSNANLSHHNHTTPQCQLQQHSPDCSTASPKYSIPTVPSPSQANSTSHTPASTTLSNALPHASYPPASNPAMSSHSPSPTPSRSSPPSLFHCEHKENKNYLIFHLHLFTLIVSNSFFNVFSL